MRTAAVDERDLPVTVLRDAHGEGQPGLLSEPGANPPPPRPGRQQRLGLARCFQTKCKL